MADVIKIKEGWHEVSLRDYLKIGSIQTDESLKDLKIQQRLRMIEVVSSYTYEELLKISSKNLGPIIEKASFIDRHPPKRNNKEVFKINGIDYIYHHQFRDMSAGEMISVEQLIMDAKNKGESSTPGVMAILFRPTDEDGKISDFDTKSWVERKEFLMDHLMVDKCHYELAFFLSNANFKGLNSLLSTSKKKKKKKKNLKKKR